MTRSLCRVASLVILVILIESSLVIAQDRTLWVSKADGSDSNNGLSEGAAFATIQKAFNECQNNDLILIKPGIYYDRPILSNCDNVWVLGHPRGGATISEMFPAARDGTATWNSVGDNRWEVVGYDALAWVVGYVDDAGEEWTLPPLLCSDLDDHIGNFDFNSPNLVEYGYCDAGDNLRVRLPNNDDPNGKSVAISNLTGLPSVAGMIINNSDNVRIDGLNIEGSGRCIYVNSTSSDSLIRNVDLNWCHVGVEADTATTIQWTRFRYPGWPKVEQAIFDLAPQDSTQATGAYAIQKEQENNGIGTLALEGTFIKGDGSATILVDHSVIQAFDGVKFQGLQNSHVTLSIFDHNTDNAIECEDDVFNNGNNNRVSYSAFIGKGFEPISWQRVDANLSCVVDHSVFIFDSDDRQDNINRLIKSVINDSSTRYGFYHNLAFLRFKDLFRDETLLSSTTRVRSNIIVADSNGLDDSPSLLAVSDNIAVKSTNPTWLTLNGGAHLTGTGSLNWINEGGLNFGITSGSVAEDIGITISDSGWDITAGFLGSAPDAGPFEVGGPNPGAVASVWPRPLVKTYDETTPQGWSHALPPGGQIVYINGAVGVNDANCGQSSGDPCLTWAFADSEHSLSGGDTVCIQNTTGSQELNEKIEITSANDGTLANPLVIDGKCDSQTARGIIDGTGLDASSPSALIALNGVAHVTLRDLEVRDYPGTDVKGIRNYNGANNIKIIRPKVHNIGTGGAASIGISFGDGFGDTDGGHTHLIEGSVPTDRFDPTTYDCQIFDGFWNGLKIADNNTGGQSSTVRNCAIWDSQGDASNSDSIQGSANAHNWTFQDNFVSNGPGGEDAMDLGWGSNSVLCIAQGGGQTGHIIERNVFADYAPQGGNGAPGRSMIVLNGCTEDITFRNNIVKTAARGFQGYAHPKNIKIYHNTFYTSLHTLRMWQMWDGFEAINNLIVSCVGTACESLRPVHIDANTRACCQQENHCLWQSNVIVADGTETDTLTMDVTGGAFTAGACLASAATANETGYTESQLPAFETAGWLGATSRTDDSSWGTAPLFTDVDNNDFSLQPGDTVGINKGQVIASVTTDFFGNPRNGSPDIGAIEFQGVPGGIFVSPTGSGSTCTTSAPCLLATGLSQAGNGETIVFKNGTYGWFDTESIGVTYLAENQHQAIILNTSSHTGGVYAIGIRHDNSIINGLAISGGCTTPGSSCGGGSGHGLVRWFASDNTTIRNALVEKSAGALLNVCGSHSSNCSNILIEDNTLRDSGFNDSGAFGEGIYIGQFEGNNIVNGVTIRRNLIQTIGCEQALDVKPGGLNVEAFHNIFEDQLLKPGNGCGFDVDGVMVSQGQLNFYENIIRNNTVAESVFRPAPLGGFVQNNVVYSNTHTGALIRPRAGGTGAATEISDNVFCSNSNTTISGSFNVHDNTFGTGTPAPDCTAKENEILALIGGGPVDPGPGSDDIASDLVAHLKFDDNLTDSAGSTIWTHSGTPAYETGQIGNAITLGGADGIVADTHQIGDTRLFAIAANPFTVSGWIKTTGEGTLVASAQSNPSERDFQIAISITQVDIYMRGTIGVITPPINDGSWHHVVVTWNGTTGKLYVDDVERLADLQVGASAEDIGEPITIGSRTGSTGFQLTGAIDDVRIYARSLDPAAVTALFVLTEPVDVNPPSVPGNLQIIQVLTGQLDASWDPSVGDPVGEAILYHVESCDGAACVDFAEDGTTTATTFSLTGLLPDTLYRVRVRAEDPSNNFSAYSTIVDQSTTGPVLRAERGGGTRTGGTYQ